MQWHSPFTPSSVDQDILCYLTRLPSYRNNKLILYDLESNRWSAFFVLNIFCSDSQISPQLSILNKAFLSFAPFHSNAYSFTHLTLQTLYLLPTCQISLVIILIIVADSLAMHWRQVCQYAWAERSGWPFGFSGELPIYLPRDSPGHCHKSTRVSNSSNSWSVA